MQQNTYRSRIRRGFGALVAAVAATVAAVSMLAAPAPALAKDYNVEATVPVTFKTAGDSFTGTAPTFTATIAPAQGETVVPKENTVTVQGAGSASFSLAYTQVGEHHYTVTQTAGNAENWTYDTQTYDVTVYAMWDEKTDSLFTQVIVEDAKGLKPEDGCTFTNSYKAPVVPQTQTTTTTTPAKQTTGRLAQTGDTTSTATVAAVAVVGAAAVCAGIAYRRSRNAE